jgi:hypothetical protein
VKQLTSAFDCHTIRVETALANGFEEPKSRGRHFAFDEDSEEEILTWIEERAERSRSVTRKVPRVFLDETICYLREFVQVMKEELVFDLDEVGMSDWEDRKDKKVVVPAALDSQMIYHRVSRNVRHISIIACIST